MHQICLQEPWEDKNRDNLHPASLKNPVHCVSVFYRLSFYLDKCKHLGLSDFYFHIGLGYIVL